MASGSGAKPPRSNVPMFSTKPQRSCANGKRISPRRSRPNMANHSTRQGLEVIRGCEFFEWDAGEATRTYGRVIPSAPGIRYIVHHQPIGTVAAFSPWNFPMSQPCRKIAGAVASGCSIILKAAEETPAGALHIAKALHDAGLPPGVLNLVFGTPAKISDYLIRQDQVRLVAFTGSTVVGKHLTTLAAQHMTPVLMELGGHAPVIVCEDTDIEAAAHQRRCAKNAQRGPGLYLTYAILRAREHF